MRVITCDKCGLKLELAQGEFVEEHGWTEISDPEARDPDNPKFVCEDCGEDAESHDPQG